MQIGSGFSAGNIFDINEITREENRRRYSGLTKQITSSGDTVDISDDAKKLYSEMIHKYDKPMSSGSGAGEETGEQKAQGSGGQGGAGDISSSTDEIEALKKQIAALKSQLMSLASQIEKSGGADSSSMGKMAAVQSQLAALEAQLNAMQESA